MEILHSSVRKRLKGKGLLDLLRLKGLPLRCASTCCNCLQSDFSLLIWTMPSFLRSGRYKICIGIRQQQAKSHRLGPNEERKISL